MPLHPLHRAWRLLPPTQRRYLFAHGTALLAPKPDRVDDMHRVRRFDAERSKLSRLRSLQRIRYPFMLQVKRMKATPNEIINYTFPYVVSFMGIAYGDPQKLIGFVVFLLWMFAITLKSGQILMNPLLLIFGWKLYEATIVINGVEKDVRV